MLVAVGCETLKVVFKEKLAEKGRILVLDGHKPRQHHGKVQHHPRPPERAVENGPLAPQECKGSDDGKGQKRRYRPLGEGGKSGEEVDVE